MPRLNFVKKSRKDNPVCKKGESYYWWKFAFGSKQYSKEQPPRSSLTQSSYYSTLWDIQDNVSIDSSDVDTSIQGIVDQLQELLDQCQESLDNMPEHLQDTSDAGYTLTERIDALEVAISELESIDISDEGEDAQDHTERIEIEVTDILNSL